NSKIGFGDLILLLRYFFKLKVSTHPIDVEPNEAQMLIGLIEMLLKEWYIARYERQKQLEDLIGLDVIKSEQKNIPKLVNE
ncbi:hypothetical protein ABTC04_01595, partial [Acinetobacter baumannii]